MVRVNFFISGEVVLSGILDAERKMKIISYIRGLVKRDLKFFFKILCYLGYIICKIY